MKDDYLVTLLKNHQKLRYSSINLVASENRLSPSVRNALASDLSGRYSSKFYGGSEFNRKIISHVEELAKEVFNSDYACITPISGHICDLAAMNAFTKPGDNVGIVSSSQGGYPFNVEMFNRKNVSIPFDETEWNIDYLKLEGYYKENNIALSIIGSSVIPFPYHLDKILEYTDNKVVYDGSHVLGLIAGGKFQNPLSEGIGTLLGSTHKSFFGPQGGIILSNDRDEYYEIAKQFSIQEKANPFSGGTVLVDNVHSNRIAALGLALGEMLLHGETYADQIIKNTVILGKMLDKGGIRVLKNKAGVISQSHQVILDRSIGDQSLFKSKLEEYGIFVDDFVRIGTSEVTRLGYKEQDMKIIAEFIIRILDTESFDDGLLSEIREYSTGKQTTHYTFEKKIDLFNEFR